MPLTFGADASRGCTPAKSAKPTPSAAKQMEIGRVAWKSGVDYFDGIRLSVMLQTQRCILRGAIGQYERREKGNGRPAHPTSLQARLHNLRLARARRCNIDLEHDVGT
jgi:hypothetical protein